MSGIRKPHIISFRPEKPVYDILEHARAEGYVLSKIINRAIIESVQSRQIIPARKLAKILKEAAQ